MFTNKFQINTPRFYLRLPQLTDYVPWLHLQKDSAVFLRRWEPQQSDDWLLEQKFQYCVWAANRGFKNTTSMALFLIRKSDNILHARSQSVSLGHWIGWHYSRRGSMSEAVQFVISMFLLSCSLVA